MKVKVKRSFNSIQHPRFGSGVFLFWRGFITADGEEEKWCIEHGTRELAKELDANGILC